MAVVISDDTGDKERSSDTWRSGPVGCDNLTVTDSIKPGKKEPRPGPQLFAAFVKSKCEMPRGKTGKYCLPTQAESVWKDANRWGSGQHPSRPKVPSWSYQE